ncbi:MAG: hypothetical protein H6R10_699 [Rhodocyclaceae bacterium]|nr:hypothetical protein [Rhodocyclaceae bacterium]
MTEATKIIISAKDETKSAIDSVVSGLGRLESASFGAGKVFSGFTAILSTAAIANNFKSYVSGAAALDDMSEKTGASVESLSALVGVAKAGGHEVEMVEQGVIRLTKALAGADEESKGAAHALSVLGLDKVKLQSMDGGQALKLVADRLSEFQDGSGKTALAIDLLGKSGAQMLPFLKDLAEQGELHGKITAEQAAQAEQLEKNWKKLEAQGGKLGKQISAELLPPMLELTEMALKLTKPGGGAEKVEIGWLDNFVATASEKLAGFNLTLSQYRTKFYESLGLTGLADQSREAERSAAASVSAIVRRQTESEAPLAKFLRENEAATGAGAKKSLSGYRSNTGAGEASAAKNAYDDLIKSIREKIVAQSLESQEQRTLTEGEKLAAKVMVDIRDRNIQLTDAQKRRVAAALDELVVLEKLNVSRKGEAEAQQYLLEVGKRFDRSLQEKADSLRILPESTARLNTELRKVDEQAADGRDKLIRMFSDGKLSAEAYAEKLGDLDAMMEAQKARVIGLNGEQDRLNSSWETGAARALQKYEDQARNVAASTEQAFSRAFSGMEDALVEFSMTGKLNFTSLANSIVSDMIRMQIRASMAPVTSAASNWLSGAVNGLFGGSTASSTGPSTGSFVANTSDTYSIPIAGARASGGPVDAGKTYLVGERGPELLRMGGGGGYVVPNDAMGGSSPVSISMPVAIDARGADAGVEQRIAAAMTQLQSWVVKTIPGVVRQAQIRNRVSPSV